MTTRILVICALIVLASANDIILLNQNLGKKVLDAKYEAGPAIWRQVKNVTFQTSGSEIISKIIVTDLRPDKDGVAALAAGGIGQDNVVIELQSPTILRGFDYRVQIFTIASNAVRSATSTTTEKGIFSSFFVPQFVTIGLEAGIEPSKNGHHTRTRLENKNVLRTSSNENSTGLIEKSDAETSTSGGYSTATDLRLDNRHDEVTQREDLNVTSPMPKSIRNSEIQKVEQGDVNSGIKNNNTSTNTEVKSDAMLRSSSITGNMEEKNNTTEKPRNTRDTAAVSKEDNNTVSMVNVAKTLRTIETTSENPVHAIATSSIRERPVEKERNAERSKDDNEDKNTPENSNVGTSKIQSSTEKPRSKRDTSTVTTERLNLTNLRNKNQNNSKETEEPQKDGPSTVSPSSLRRIGDPQDKFGETGTTQNDEGFSKISTTQAPRIARNSEVKNIDTTTKPEADNFNTDNKSEKPADYKFRAWKHPSTKNINEEKEIGTTQASKTLVSTAHKNKAHTDKPTLSDDTDSKPQVHMGVPFRTLSLSSTEIIGGKKNTAEKLRIGRDTVTETTTNDSTGKGNITLRNIETTANPTNSTSPSPINTKKRHKNAVETHYDDASKEYSSPLRGPTGEDHKNQPRTKSGENLNTTPKPRMARDLSYYPSDSYHYVPMRYHSVQNSRTTARAMILLETEMDMPINYKQ